MYFLISARRAGPLEGWFLIGAVAAVLFRRFFDFA
jgi:hypothetical protein